jgi:hypothetical protein
VDPDKGINEGVNGDSICIDNFLYPINHIGTWNKLVLIVAFVGYRTDHIGCGL